MRPEPDRRLADHRAHTMRLEHIGKTDRGGECSLTYQQVDRAIERRPGIVAVRRSLELGKDTYLEQ